MEELKKAFDNYYNNIDAEKENYEKDKLHYPFADTVCYKDGYKKIARTIENYYGERYKCSWIYEQLHGNFKRIEPYIMLKKENKKLNDGIYLYLSFSNDSNDKYIYLSLELGNKFRYVNKDDIYITNCLEIRNKYSLDLEKINKMMFELGNVSVENDEYSIINYKIYDIVNIISYVDILANIYDIIIEDINSIDKGKKIWGSNWEEYQSNLFGDNYIMKDVTAVNEVKDNSSKLNNIKDVAYNMIYYGVPGCGKSYYVGSKFNEKEYSVYRTTFYPDYSNSDFVGQIIPRIKKKQVYYEVQGGPFSQALLEAYRKPNKKVCLIIEEINRGNASAIFGDVFQLLDRESNGESQFGIDNYIIYEYFNDNNYKINGKIKIQPNLWIIGTMNTSDQNVYTLDTAFKRRWKMKKLTNKFGNSVYDKELSNMKIPGSTYTWAQFVDRINREILLNNPGGLNGEDKQLGIYFVSLDEFKSHLNNDSIEAKEYFAEKVLMYIWDDIAKINPIMWFDKDYKSFDELEESFKVNGLKIFNNIFVDDKKILEDSSDE